VILDPEVSEIGHRPCPSCVLCGSSGIPRYDDLPDPSGNSPGVWSLKECSNPACGVLWPDPIPREDELWKAYVTYYTHQSTKPAPKLLGEIGGWMTGAYLRGRYGYHLGVGPRWRGLFYPLVAGFFGIFPGLRDLIDGTVGYLPAPRGHGRLLEIGFGSGDFLRWTRQLGWDVVGIDVDPQAVENARADGLEVRRGELAEQGFPDGSFKAIYCSHLLEHVYDPVSLLNECFRVLAPGGRLVITTPNVQSWGHRHFGQHWIGLDPPRHLVIFTLRALHDLTENAGYRIVELRSSARVGGLMCGNSALIRSTGVYQSEAGEVPGWIAREALKQHLLENARLWLDPLAGEELVLVASKPRQQG
jgi:SAM-dependent methyltransferase